MIDKQLKIINYCAPKTSTIKLDVRFQFLSVSPDRDIDDGLEGGEDED